MKNSNQEWVTEIERSIQSGSREKRVDSLRKVTNLFLSSSDRYNDEQIDVFDNVLCRLTEKIETRALAELSQRLAPIPNAPNDVIQRLARNDEITVAGPVLTASKRLTDGDLREIASTKSQAHLLAISGRRSLASTVTDIIVERGEGEVLHRLLKNTGSRFSDNGFSALIAKAGSDESLAEQIGRRLDIPIKLFRELLARATEAVKAKLLAMKRPESRNEIEQLLAQISDQVGGEEAAPRDFGAAHRHVLAMKNAGRLNQEAILSFVRANEYENLVAGISEMCGLPFELIDRLMHIERSDALLIPCKAAGFDWPAVRNILKNRPSWKMMSEADLEKAWADYIRLSKPTAERINRFWMVREKVGKTADA
jgi:uncharacterized protein (DUF2336 family)